MKIEVFEQLLKGKKGNGERAYVPDSRSGSRQARVAVVFSPGGKVYYYRGTIHAIAARLDLIPSIDVVADSKRIVRELLTIGVSIGFQGCTDTVRMMLWKRGVVAQDDSGWSSTGTRVPLVTLPTDRDKFDWEQFEYRLEVK